VEGLAIDGFHQIAELFHLVVLHIKQDVYVRGQP